MKKILIALLGLTLSNVSAQQKIHTVAAKESLYAISRKYGVRLDELIKQNPKIKNGKLDIGDVLVIPITTINTIKTSPQKLGKIYLQPKQTIYGITRQYKISETELRKLNPNLDNNMKIGNTVVLPEENIKKYANVSAKKMPETTTTYPIIKEETNIVSQNPENYVVQPGDTYFSITRKFGISKENLFALNSGLERKGLQAGDILYIIGMPDAKVSQQNSTSKIKSYALEKYLTHTVKKGDTAFGIINKYNISYEQLSELNDGLRSGLKEGSELKIKKYEKHYLKVDDDIFNIALMLPFGHDSNDDKYRNLAMDFLLGSKLAAERNAAQGKKISLNVIDAENEDSFKNNISQINKTNTDLIIGPFFKSNILEVLNYVKDEKIPVVAPFAHTTDLYDHSHLILVETHSSVYAERIAKEVQQVYANQKIHLIGERNNEEVIFLRDQLGKNLPKADIEIVSSPDEISLERNIMTGQNAPAIIILANDNDQIGEAFAKKIIALGKETDGIKAFSMYYHNDFEKNIDELSKTNLVYLMDRKINTEGKFEKEVLADFRKKYCKIPSKYAIIGFDVVNDMLARENSGEVIKQMEKTQTQLATKFEYVRSKKNGAFINTGYRVVRLIP